jgi:hypothetical protein
LSPRKNTARPSRSDALYCSAVRSPMANNPFPMVAADKDT